MMDILLATNRTLLFCGFAKYEEDDHFSILYKIENEEGIKDMRIGHL